MTTCSLTRSFAIAALTLIQLGSPSAAVVFESASADALSSNSGITVGGASSQIYGAAFQLSTSVAVTGIGGLFLAQGRPFPNDIFGALIRLDSIAALPGGTGLSDADVVAGVVFNVTTSGDVTAPLSATLDHGAYAVVFGSGEFGASGVAALPPTGQVYATNYLGWNTNSGSWFGGDGYGRVFVLGTPVAVSEPTSLTLAALALAGIAAVRRRRA